MSKILISGCGLTWSAQERPAWVNVLKLCGVIIDDQAGPAISNQLILNNMIESVLHNEYSQAICQLTSTRKLDVEVTDKRKTELVGNDTIRNFTYKGYWPSSASKEHESKKLYYEYLHSPTLEQSDLVYKWMLLNKLCQEKNIKLHTVLGYRIDWVNKEWRDTIITDHDYTIWDDYTLGEYWKYHDHSLGDKNTVPNKYFMIHLAKKMNHTFLKLDIEQKLEKFGA
jgi:hypothetical protein